MVANGGNRGGDGNGDKFFQPVAGAIVIPGTEGVGRDGGDAHTVDGGGDGHIDNRTVTAGDDTGLPVVVQIAAAIGKRVGADDIGNGEFHADRDGRYP